MKAIFIDDRSISEIEINEFKRDNEYMKIITEYTTMESHVVYFSAGDAKIKEILISKDPVISA